MRTSGKQSSVITQPYHRNSQAGVSEFSDHKIGTSKISKSKLKDESSLNKSSRDPVDEDVNSDSQDDDESQSSGVNSDVFVRTKAANISSFDDPDLNGLDTVKNNDKVGEGQAGIQGSSRDQNSFASDMKTTL